MKRILLPLQCASPGPKIVVGMPMYRHVSVAWFYNWMLMDKSPCVGVVSTEGVPLPSAMDGITNTAVSAFGEWDWLVVFEDDIIPPLDAFLRVTGYDEDVDIVGSLNFMHEPPHYVNAYTLGNTRAEPMYRNVKPDVLRGWLEEGNRRLFEVDAVAMGFTAIRRRVIERWDQDVPMWCPSAVVPGQDIYFCHEATRQGFSVWLDTGMRCGHLTEVAVSHGAGC